MSAATDTTPASTPPAPSPAKANTQRLEALAEMAQGVDAENPSAESRQEQAAQAAAISQEDANARAWGMVMFTVGGFVQMVAPELRAVYSEERCFAWGQQAGAVAKKYGWDGPSAMPELALIASTLGFAVPTYLVIKGKLADQKESQEGTLLGKLKLWWKHRKDAKAGPAVPPPGAGNGQQ